MNKASSGVLSIVLSVVLSIAILLSVVPFQTIEVNAVDGDTGSTAEGASTTQSAVSATDSTSNYGISAFSLAGEGDDDYTEITALPTASGNYRLTGNITGTKSYANGEQIVIDLNGYSITAPASGRIFRLSNGASVKIIDSSEGKTGRLYVAASGAPKGGIAAMFNEGDNAADTALIIENVTIDGQGYSAATAGGAIRVEVGTFTMSGGTIKNCVSADGGAISVNGSKAKAYLYYVTLTGNKSTATGGALSVTTNAQVTVSGCVISDNSAANGGAIYEGGASSHVELSGGTKISNNKATTDGGAIYMANGKMTVKAATISDNSAKNGGGVKLANAAELTLSDAQSVISGNTASGAGGGIYIDKNSNNCTAKLIMQNGSVSANESTSGGGGIRVDSTNASAEIAGGTISGNTAGSGAGIFSNGTLTVSNAAITGNISKSTGGGIQAQGTTDISSTSFTNNQAATLGGAIYVVHNMTLTDCTVTGNTASGSAGGGIYQHSSSFTVTLGGKTVITGNTASSASSNVYLKTNGKLALSSENALAAGSAVGVTVEDPAAGRIVISNAASNASDYFVYDTGEYGIGISGSDLVLGDKLTGISISDQTCKLASEETKTLTLTFTPDSAVNKSVVWSSNNPDVATVDENGKVTAIVDGTAIITATSVDGGFEVSCTVTVETPVSQVTLNKSSINLMVGSSETLTAEVLPAAVGNKQVKWSSSAPDVVSVDENGKITALKEGKAVITVAAASNEKITASCTVIALTEHIHTGYSCDCGEGNEWKAWTSTTTLPTTSGYYYLTDNVTLSSNMVTISNVNVVLCLNGKNVTAQSAGRVYKLNGGASLTICDCTASVAAGTYKAGSLVGGSAEGGCIWANSGNSVVIYDGILTGATNTAIMAWSSQSAPTTITMKDGQISGNSAKSYTGGAVHIHDAYTTFNMQGGTITGNTATNGGAIGTKGKIVISGGTISNNIASSMGGAIYAEAGASVNASGGAFSGNSAVTGGAVYMAEGLTGSVSISNVSISTNKTSKAGAAIRVDGGKLTLSDSTISGNESQTGAGGVYIKSGCSATLDNVSFTKNSSVENGGAIVNLGTLDASKCKFTENTTNGNGGAIWCGGSTELNGCTLSGNAADGNGGAVYVSGSVTVTVDGCTISTNNAKKQGGAVWVTGADVTVKNSTVTGNKSGTNVSAIYGQGGSKLTVDSSEITGNECGSAGYGAVCVPNSGSTLTLKGKVIIKDNVSSAGVASNLSIRDDGGATVNVSQLDPESVIYFMFNTYEAGKVLSNNAGSSDLSSCFTSDRWGYYIEKKDGKLLLAMDSTLEHVHDCDDEKNVKWTPWYETDSLPKTSGHYFLMSDVELTAAQAYTGAVDVHICLNGHTVKQTAKNVRLLRISDGAKVTICDCTNNGMLTGGNLPNDANTGSGGCVLVTGSGSSFTLLSGSITGNKAGRHAGAIVCQSGATLYIKGGQITNNTAANGNGGAIFVSDGKLYISGGTISGNTASGSAGGVYISSNTVGTDLGKMTGGVISGNSSGSDGAGVYLSAGKFTISGGSVTQNSSKTAAGGINVRGGATLTMNGGTVSDNTAKKSGGGVVVASNSILKLSGGTISGNKSETGHGGGVYIVKECQIVMTGGKIIDNYAKGRAGGVYLEGNGIFSGGSIQKNTSGSDGAGVYMGGSNTMVLSGTYITGNYSGTAAGGINVRGGAKLIMSGGSVSNNTARKSGGGIVVTTKGGLDFRGGTVSGNEAMTGSGGGIFINSGCLMYMSGGKVSENIAAKNGAGIYLGGNGQLTGGTVEANVAANEGGGIYMGGKNELKLAGADIVGNSAASGGGIVVRGAANLIFESGSFSKNTATNHGGAMLLQSSGTLTMTGGTVSDNTAGSTGGGIRTTDTNISITGGSFTGNMAGGQGGAIYTQAVDSVIENTRFEGNKANATSSSYKSYGGAILLGTNSQVEIKNCVFSENEAAGSGAAIAFWHTKNSTVDSCEFNDGNARSFGGAIYVSTNAKAPVSNSSFTGNNGSTRGGALYVDSNGVLVSSNNTVTNNSSANGGAIYVLEGGTATLTADKLNANEAKLGSAIYSCGTLELYDAQITGNKASELGAVYIDGEANSGLTMESTNTFGGDLVIRDNDGGDTYITNDAVVFVSDDGLGENAYVLVELESGFVTDMVFGSYDYEKIEALKYLLTAGTRSLTDPEGDTSSKGNGSCNIALIGGAVFLLAIIAAVLLIIKKKKENKEAK